MAMWRWFRTKSASGRPARPGAAVLPSGWGRARRSTPDWEPTLPLPLLDRHEQEMPRRAELRRLAALQSRGDTAYQYVVETAARICDTPLAGISLFDGDAMQFKAVLGLSAAGLPADSLPCRLAMGSDEPISLLGELAADMHTDHAPLTLAERPLRFYAGARLGNAGQAPAGTVWVADVVERELTPVQLRTLELLAQQTALLVASQGRPAA
jgi:GAF domain-containing protein